jgi:pyruvate kinase
MFQRQIKNNNHSKGTQVCCLVRVAGPLSNNTGINRQGGGWSPPALTDKDLRDIQLASDIQ